MAAEVGTRMRVMDDEGDEKSKRDLITRDLLGRCEASLTATEELDLDLDLDVDVPLGWERCLDLLSGRTYLQKCEDPISSRVKLQDLNLPPLATISPAGVLMPLDLRSAATASEYQSVCTLEKVKSALDRAEREARIARRPRGSGASVGGSSSSPSSSTTSSSFKRLSCDDGDDASADGSHPPAVGAMLAAGCPGCLLYVLISRHNPRCPRCDSHVPSPVLPKRLRLIDLNSDSSQQL